MQTRSSARNTKKKEPIIPLPTRRGSRDATLAKTSKEVAPPEEPSSPESPPLPSSHSHTSTSSEAEQEKRTNNETVDNNESKTLNIKSDNDTPIQDSSKSNETSKNSTTINTSGNLDPPAASKATTKRSMTLRSSLGARPKRRIWSPESSKKSWSDEARFQRLPSKKGPRRQIRTYDSEDSSSDSSELDRRSSKSRRKGSRRSRKIDSSDESLGDSDEEDSDDSESEEDSDEESEEDSFDSDEDLRVRKRKRSKSRHRKRKVPKQGVKSDTEGAEALMGLADSVLLMDEEPKRSKGPQHSPRETRSSRKHRPRPQPKKDERARDPSFDIRTFLVPPPVFPKMAAGNIPAHGAAPQQPIWKRGALHAAIAYYVFYQQRYDLLQQLSVPNAQYAQKFLLALSLDPTAEAKMLRERAEAAKQQLLQSRNQDTQSKIAQEPASVSPSSFSLYPNSSPSSGFVQPQARKPTPISLSPLAHSAARSEATSVVILDSPIAPSSQRTSTAFSVIDNQMPEPASNRTTSSSQSPSSSPSKPSPSTEPVPSEPTPTTSAEALTESVSLDPLAEPSTPTSQNTSLEVDLSLATAQEMPPLRSEDSDSANTFDPTFLNFEDDTVPSKSEPVEVTKEKSLEDADQANSAEDNARELQDYQTVSSMDTSDGNVSDTLQPIPAGEKPTQSSETATPMELEDAKPTKKELTTQPTKESQNDNSAYAALSPQNTKPNQPITPTAKSNAAVALDSAEWNSFPLGSTFRKGRLSVYTPAHVMVSPFNYLMTPTVSLMRKKTNGRKEFFDLINEQSRLPKSNNTEAEELNNTVDYTRQHQQQQQQQRQQYLNKTLQQPFPIHPSFFPQQMPPSPYLSRLPRNHPHYMSFPPRLSKEEEERQQLLDPQLKHSLEQRMYPPGFTQPPHPPTNPHFQAPDWHQFMQYQAQTNPGGNSEGQHGNNQAQAPQNPGAPFHMDQRNSVMLRVNPPHTTRGTENDVKHPLQESESWTQFPIHKHAQAHNQTAQQAYQNQQIQSTQSTQSPRQPIQPQPTPLGPTQPLSPQQQQQMNMRHSTENLAQLKRQIRSKALARGGSVFGGNIRRNVQLQQQQQSTQQQQQNANQQPPQQQSTQSQPSGDSGDQPRYILIRDDTEEKNKSTNHDSKPIADQVSLDLTAADNVEKGPQQTQLQQQLQQQQLRMLQQQREQAALLEYQKQMHQRSLGPGGNGTSPTETANKATNQPIPSDPNATTPGPPTNESAISFASSQHNLQRLQQLHFQFKQQQRLQQMQKHPQQSQQAANQPPPQPGSQQNINLQAHKQPVPPYVVQYFQHYPNPPKHAQLQTQPVTAISIQPSGPSANPPTNQAQSQPQQNQTQQQQQVNQQPQQQTQSSQTPQQPHPQSHQQQQQSQQPQQQHQHLQHPLHPLSHIQPSQQQIHQSSPQMRSQHPQQPVHLFHQQQMAMQQAQLQHMHMSHIQKLQEQKQKQSQDKSSNTPNTTTSTTTTATTSTSSNQPENSDPQKPAQPQTQDGPPPRPHPSQINISQIQQAQQYILQQTRAAANPSQQPQPQQPNTPRGNPQPTQQQWQYLMAQYPQKGGISNPQTPINVQFPIDPHKIAQQQQQIILHQQQTPNQQQQQQQQQQQPPQNSGPILMQFTQVSPSKFRKSSNSSQSLRTTQRQSQQQSPQSSTPLSPSHSTTPPPQISLSSSQSSPALTSSQNLQPQFQKLQLEPLVRPPKQETTKSSTSSAHSTNNSNNGNH